MFYKTLLTLSFLLFFLSGFANPQTNIPETIKGNWINEKTSNWEYGFYEKFAIYRNDFWEYEDIHTEKSYLVLKLKKGNQTQNLRIKLSKNNASLSITRNREKPTKYKLNRLGFFEYDSSDEKPFKNSGFRSDTVTIIGYYHNIDKFLKAAEHERQKGPFEVTVPDFIMDKSVEYYADFDSLGRFTIKFPILNTQEVYLDWKRLTRQDVVEPGETIFLFVDMADYIPKEPIKSRNEGIAFRNTPKNILYMGKEARLHNELARYNQSSNYFNPEEAIKKVTSDKEFLNEAKANYGIRLAHLESYIMGQRSLSGRFKEFQFASEKYQLAMSLMQHRFNKLRKDHPGFDEGYMEFVDSLVDFNDQKLFTLVRDYSIFIRDYLGYYKDLNASHLDKRTGKYESNISVNDGEVLMDMKDKGIFNKEEEKTIEGFLELLRIHFSASHDIKDTARVAELVKPYRDTPEKFNAIVERLGIKDSLAEMRLNLLQKKSRTAELKQIDLLIENKILKELLIARILCGIMEHARVPLSTFDLKVFEERISVQSLKDYILEMNSQYIKLSNKEISSVGSIKNTENLKEAKDADALFNELIAPYKGKVIYLDFWGTWCGPCRKQMSYVGDVKKELKGKEVIFMYLANNSPETSWKNFIKEMNLTGENVVHYRLPDAQEAMIERKFSVNSFPTYILIGKDGKLIRDNVPQPEMRTALIDAIDKLVKD